MSFSFNKVSKKFAVSKRTRFVSYNEIGGSTAKKMSNRT